MFNGFRAKVRPRKEFDRRRLEAGRRREPRNAYTSARTSTAYYYGGLSLPRALPPWCWNLEAGPDGPR